MKYLNFLLLTFFVIFAFKPVDLSAQYIGIETGYAGIENHSGKNFNGSVSAGLELGDRGLLNFSYTQWTATSANYEFDIRNNYFEEGSQYFGDKGLNALLSFRVFESASTQFYIGGGFGLYEFFQGKKSDRISTYHSSNSLQFLLRRSINSRLAIYGRTLISIPVDNIAPNWGFFNIGLAYDMADVVGLPNKSSGNIQRTAPASHTIYYEIGGANFRYSMNYEYKFKDHLSGRFGYGGYDAKYPDSLGYFTVMLNYFVGHNSHLLEIGVGPTVGLNREQENTPYLEGITTVLGYRYQPEYGGMMLRLGPVMMIESDGLPLPGAGISIGYGF